MGTLLFLGPVILDLSVNISIISFLLEFLRSSRLAATLDNKLSKHFRDDLIKTCASFEDSLKAKVNAKI